MAAISTSTKILVPFVSQLQMAGFTSGQINSLISYINGSPLLVNQLLDLQNKDGSIVYSSTGGSYTLLNPPGFQTPQIGIGNIATNETYIGYDANPNANMVNSFSSVAKLVASLAHVISSECMSWRLPIKSKNTLLWPGLADICDVVVDEEAIVLRYRARKAAAERCAGRIGSVLRWMRLAPIGWRSILPSGRRQGSEP
jgi:hypothetical protein